MNRQSKGENTRKFAQRAKRNFEPEGLSFLEFLRQQYTWQVTGLFVCLSVPPYLIIVWRTGPPYNFQDFILLLPIVVLFGLIGAGNFQVRLTVPRVRVISIIGSLGLVCLFIGMVQIAALWDRLTFVETLIRLTTLDNLIQVTRFYWLVCYGVWGIWSVFISLCGQVEIFMIELVKLLIHLASVYQMLINVIRLRRNFIWTVVLIGIYWVWIVIQFGVQNSVLANEWQQILVLFHSILVLLVSVLGFIVLTLLLITTLQYMLPQELERVRLGFSIERTILLLVSLFSMWWFFFTAAAANLTMARPGAFIFADGLMEKPGIKDFMFYTFAVMTNAGYSELKPVGETARWMVMAMTTTGLTLLVLFVGVALSLRDPDSSNGVLVKNS